MHTGAPLLLGLLAPAALAQQPSLAPELGAVAWGRDLAAAQTASKADGRPVLVLFQEVPG